MSWKLHRSYVIFSRKIGLENTNAGISSCYCDYCDFSDFQRCSYNASMNPTMIVDACSYV